MAYYSNATEADGFQEQCASCPLGEEPCPVASVQFIYNYDQMLVPKLREVMNIFVSEESGCQMLPLIEKIGKET